MRASLAIPLALLVGVVVRLPFWGEALRTPVDGDTAIVGLMARHPGLGGTLWGQPYGSPLDAWVAMPFVWTLGTRIAALRLPVFLLGLLLIPAAYWLGRTLHPRGALPAAMLLACPPPYLLLLSALAPPFYATTLALCALILVIALGAGRRLQEPGAAPWLRLAGFGALSGLALWTHLMAAGSVAASAAYLAWCSRRWPRPRRLALAAAAGVPLLLASAPFWTRLLDDRQATRIVRVADREASLGGHLAALLPRLHEPVGGILGSHVPLIADDARYLVRPPWAARGALGVLDALLLALAVSRARSNPAALLLVAVAGLALVAFPLPLRSSPDTIRFLTPMALPVLVLMASVAAERPRRAALVVLTLATLHLLGALPLLAEWRRLDRAAPPFQLPDLAPLRRALEARGIRHAYASYGPAYRLTFESGERIVASQPWNERFRHYPLPYLDEVRFASNVAWVLTPKIPTDLPTPQAFEAALKAIGGGFRRSEVGEAVVFEGFTPPFGPEVEAWPDAGPAGDLNLETRRAPDPLAPTTLRLPAPRPLEAVTLVAGPAEPALLRSMDVEVSADGVHFETVARRRRREERNDLRWVNGQPQYVLDHDLIAVPLWGRPVVALRITPYASNDAWGLAEVLLHPAQGSATRRPWDEWLKPGLSWPARRAALLASPHPEREDWHYRLLLARRH